MVTRRTISGDRLGALAQYGLVDEVAAAISRAGIATEEFVLQVTLTWKSFAKISNVLM